MVDVEVDIEHGRSGVLNPYQGYSIEGVFSIVQTIFDSKEQIDSKNRQIVLAFQAANGSR
jgi:hypothetical protein